MGALACINCVELFNWLESWKDYWSTSLFYMCAVDMCVWAHATIMLIHRFVCCDGEEGVRCACVPLVCGQCPPEAATHSSLVWAVWMCHVILRTHVNGDSRMYRVRHSCTVSTSLCAHWQAGQRCVRVTQTGRRTQTHTDMPCEIRVFISHLPLIGWLLHLPFSANLT